MAEKALIPVKGYSHLGMQQCLTSI